jgi:cation transport ATPase
MMQPIQDRIDQTRAKNLALPIVTRDDQQSHEGDDDDDAHGLDRIELLRIGFVALAVVMSWLQFWRPIPSFDLLAWGATLIGAYPIFKEALSALLSRRMTMEASMTIALAAALSIGEAFTALVIVLFVLVAEVLEHLTVGRGRKAIRDLMDFLRLLDR